MAGNSRAIAVERAQASFGSPLGGPLANTSVSDLGL